MSKGRAQKKKPTRDAMDDLQERLDAIADELLPGERLAGHSRAPASRSAKPEKRGMMAEKTEDDVMLKRDEVETSGRNGNGNTVSAQPRILKNGVLRAYQLAGLQWLVQLYRNGTNGILADEMGLGKTVQAIAMIGFLAMQKETAGSKSLIVAPKSVNGNWLKEFAKWLPSLRVVNVGGDKEERAEKLKDVKSGKFDVVVTSFEIVCLEKAKLRKVPWHYFVIDEAHRIKNEKSLLSQIVREFKSNSRLLLTGTPLQNNLHELWALLNFLMPQHFADAEEFDEMSAGKTEQVTAQLQKMLRPFLLRRLKSDVEAGLPDKTQVA
jgi:SWI/SNF-related matrix-associated actin-dependent regulator of chromatin subfamily A member 5